jgi:signal transduction histidine kinase
VITPIDYDQHNEFTPIVVALDEIHQQVSTYLEQIRTSGQKIERLNSNLEQQVADRTRQLQSKTSEALGALEQLKITQQQLIDNEKHAALGRLVAGVAHEINTPLGISVTAASCVDKALTEAFEGMLSGQFKRSQLRQKYVSITEGCKILNDNLQRASELVVSFKLVAVDQEAQDCRLLKLHNYIDDVTRSLGPKIKRTSHEVKLRGDADIEIYTQPGALAQILTNLIDNALLHGLSDRQNGVIDIMTQRLKDDIEIRLTDNGKGMTEEVQTCIFDPFFTTSRSTGGSGLGLHVVYNLVTQTLLGSINCQSMAGEGTTFTIVLPSSL